MTTPGRIVILNGAPRSGKTTVARALQDTIDGTWVQLGVDASVRSTPARLQPGIGLRPGGEYPDLEGVVVLLYGALYESIAAHARIGLDVVVDVGHHEWYAAPRHILRDCARRLAGLPVLWVGVRCPIEVVWRRREETWGQSRRDADEDLVAAVERWQQAVHAHNDYDLEVDTSVQRPEECARRIADRWREGPGRAFSRLCERGGTGGTRV